MDVPEEKPINLNALNSQAPQPALPPSGNPGKGFSKRGRKAVPVLLGCVLAVLFWISWPHLKGQMPAELNQAIGKFSNFRPALAAFQRLSSFNSKSTAKPLPQSMQSALSGLRLEGFAGNTSVSSAVINGDVFEVGQEVQGYQIVGIVDGLVKLIKDGKNYSLTPEGGLKAVEGERTPAIEEKGSVSPPAEPAQA